ncbi:hypothetical protein DVH24_021192 [Malus domestica]|uniref:Uncharacterized protein n=1 Tax=Malus domestica TaxID=3750 RepID=A0A498KVT2_MALDO|nr:hypothetical protein DVH24_021192 [Malus domestica]
MPKSPHPPHVSNSDPTFPVSDLPRSSPTSLSQAIMFFLNGDTIPHIFITIIHYALPSEDHTVQKLLLLYLEIIDKTNSKGSPIEMILICQTSATTSIIELLIPSILANLEHRHPFVSGIGPAIMLVRLPQGETLLDSAPEENGGEGVGQGRRFLGFQFIFF